jgi:flavin-binding protein dodecin
MTTNITDTAPAAAEQPAGGAPALRDRTEAAAEAFRPIVSAVGRDLVRGIGEASTAVSRLGAGTDRDVSVSALTALECVGPSPADALLAAADALRFGDTLTVHGLLWARVPDTDGEVPWNWRVTLLVSALDPEFGEADAPAHQAEPAKCRIKLYLDTDSEAPEGALAASQHEALTQAEALHRAAVIVRECKGLEIEGLLWARVPKRRPGGWEYRLTVLASSTAPEQDRSGSGVPANLGGGSE